MLIGTILACTVWTLVHGQALEEMVPGDVPLYVRMDFQVHGLEDTSIHRLFHEDEVRDCLNAISGALEQQRPSFSARTGLTLLDWHDALSNELAFALFPADADEFVPAHWVLLLREGELGSPSAAAIEKFAAKRLDSIEGPETNTISGVTITYLADQLAWARNDDLLLVGSPRALALVLRKRRNALAVDPSLADFRASRAPEGELLLGRIRVRRLLTMLTGQQAPEFENVLNVTPPGKARTTDVAIVPDAQGLKLHALVRLSDSPRRASLIPVDFIEERQALQLIPPHATFFHVFNLDIPAVYAVLSETVASLAPGPPPQGSSPVEQAVAAFEAAADVNVEGDFLSAVGQRLILFAGASQPMSMMSPLCLLIEVREQQAMTRFLEGCLTFIHRQTSGQEESRPPSMSFYGHTIHYIKPQLGLPVSPALTVAKGNLIIALSPIVLKEYLAFLDAGGPGIDRDDDFRAVRLHVSMDANTLMYTRFQDVAMNSYALLPMLLDSLGTQTDAGFSSANLPLPETVRKHLFPSISLVRKTEDGIILEGYSPIGVPVVSLGDRIAPAMMLPALGRARGEARATQCRSNLRQIGLGLLMYASDHQDRGPTHLQALLEDGYLTRKGAQVLSCSERKGRQDGDEQDYVLRAAIADGSMLFTSAVGEPVVWDNPALMFHGNRINVLFGDGSVKTTPASMFGPPPSDSAREWPELVEALRMLYGTD